VLRTRLIATLSQIDRTEASQESATKPRSRTVLTSSQRGPESKVRTGRAVRHAAALWWVRSSALGLHLMCVMPGSSSCAASARRRNTLLPPLSRDNRFLSSSCAASSGACKSAGQARPR